MTEEEEAPLAVVVRSACHVRTWIAHVQYASFADTPAGPLRVVKRAVELMLREDEGVWRKDDDHTWAYEAKVVRSR